MNQFEKDLLDKWMLGNIEEEYLLSIFPVDIRNDTNFVISEVEKAIATEQIEEIEYAITLIWLSDKKSELVDLLHTLLLNLNHYSHQAVVRSLQDLKNPKSVPFIERVLETNFDYLTYTGSDSDAIAKWFSWALYSIGTDEAIELIKKYSHSEDEGIRKEMLYRLKQIQ